jgi:hypothetical protein
LLVGLQHLSYRTYILAHHVPRTPARLSQPCVPDMTECQSAWRAAAEWTVRCSNTGDGESFRTHKCRPGGPPSLLCNAYRVSFFFGGKAVGACPWRPPPHPHRLQAPGVQFAENYTRAFPQCLRCLQQDTAIFRLIQGICVAEVSDL